MVNKDEYKIARDCKASTGW